jgi:hypothetical protein
MTTPEHLTPADLEERFRAPVDHTALVALIDALTADPDWSVVEEVWNGRLAQVALTYAPTGQQFTLSRRDDDGRGRDET